MTLLTLLLVLSDLLELTFTVTKHITVFTITLTQHVMHLVRCSDLATKTLQWVSVDTTQYLYDAVGAARKGRVYVTPDHDTSMVSSPTALVAPKRIKSKPIANTMRLTTSTM